MKPVFTSQAPTRYQHDSQSCSRHSLPRSAWVATPPKDLRLYNCIPSKDYSVRGGSVLQDLCKLDTHLCLSKQLRECCSLWYIDQVNSRGLSSLLNYRLHPNIVVAVLGGV